MTILELKYPDFTMVKNVVEAEVQAYIHAVTVLSSLKENLKENGLECHVEMKIYKNDGSYKTPDLLICSDNYIIVDHKYTQSKDVVTLKSKIEEMKEYDTQFVFNHDCSGGSKEFNPEIVMLTPERVTHFFKELLVCPVTWGYELSDHEIVIKQSIGLLKDQKVSSLFKPDLIFQKGEDVNKYRFIVSHAPLPYTACQVYIILFTLLRADQFFIDEFEAKYDKILTNFNALFPPWVRPEVKQLNVTRLREALHFLQSIGWIKWYEAEKTIIVDRNKGRLTGDVLSYFIDNFAKNLHGKMVRDYERKNKELEEMERKTNAQKQISDFFK